MKTMGAANGLGLVSKIHSKKKYEGWAWEVPLRAGDKLVVGADGAAGRCQL
jgi:hypothetical protein